MSSKRANKPEKYPEHVKLQAISDKSQCCYEFMDFIFSKGYHLGKYEGKSDFLVPSQVSVLKLLAEFFEIDMEVIEREKKAMIDECVAMQNRRVL